MNTLCVFLAILGLSSAAYNSYPRGCIYANGQCVQECPVGTVSYTINGCGYVTREATCRNSRPKPDKQQTCGYSKCHCVSPTVRDEATNQCVHLDKCPGAKIIHTHGRGGVPKIERRPAPQRSAPQQLVTSQVPVAPQKSVVPQRPVVPVVQSVPTYTNYNNAVAPQAPVAPRQPVVPQVPVAPQQPVVPQRPVAPVVQSVPTYTGYNNANTGYRNNNAGYNNANNGYNANPGYNPNTVYNPNTGYNPNAGYNNYNSGYTNTNSGYGNNAVPIAGRV